MRDQIRRSSQQFTVLKAGFEAGLTGRTPGHRFLTFRSSFSFREVLVIGWEHLKVQSSPGSRTNFFQA
jgi:hypothetical protein